MRVGLVEDELPVKTNYRMTCAEFDNFTLGKRPLLTAVKGDLNYIHVHVHVHLLLKVVIAAYSPLRPTV